MAHNKLRREITAYMEGGPSSAAGMLTTAHQLLVRAFAALGGAVDDTREAVVAPAPDVYQIRADREGTTRAIAKARTMGESYGMPVGRIDVEEEAGPDAMLTPPPYRVGDVVYIRFPDGTWHGFPQRIIRIEGDDIEVGLHRPGSHTDLSNPYVAKADTIIIAESSLQMPHAPTEAEWQDIGRPSHGLGASESE